MVQKFDDAKTLIAKDRKTKALLILGGIGLLLIFFLFSNSKYERPPMSTPEVPKMTSPSKEHLDDYVARYETQMEELQRGQEESKKEMQELGNRLDVYERRTSDIFKKILEKIADIDTRNNESDYADAQTGVVGDDLMVEDGKEDDEGKDQLESFFDQKENVKEVKKETTKKVAFVAPGDTVRVKLLGGVNAPTDGTPYPVIFKLLSHVSGPDNSQLPLGEARLIAAAQGSIVDQRALFRLTKLSIRLPNGERKVVDVDGWIVGEDGIRGLKGILIDPIGKAIAGGMMAGTIAGFGEGVEDANTRIRSTEYGYDRWVSGNTTEYAFGKGLSKGAEVWSDILKDRIKEMVPVVQVLSGREATATFSNEVTIDSLYEQLEEGQGDQFGGLD